MTSESSGKQVAICCSTRARCTGKACCARAPHRAVLLLLLGALILAVLLAVGPCGALSVRMARKRANAKAILAALPAELPAFLDGAHGGVLCRSAALCRALLDRNSSVLVVGNGPVKGNLGSAVDAFDIVVRINTFAGWDTADGRAEVGTKTDIFVWNLGQPKRDIPRVLMFRNKAMLRTAIGLTIECTNRHANYDERLRKGWVFAPRLEYLRVMCDAGSMSTGMKALLFLRKAFRQVHILGFAGQGHHGPVSKVNCGGHTAATCAHCPAGHGERWCKGDCAWSDRNDAQSGGLACSSCDARCVLNTTPSKRMWPRNFYHDFEAEHELLGHWLAKGEVSSVDGAPVRGDQRFCDRVHADSDGRLYSPWHVW